MSEPPSTTDDLTPSLWYLAICVQCGDGLRDPLPMPFDDREKRWEWVDAHLTTGHQILVLNQPRPDAPWHVAHARETGHETFANTMRSGCRTCGATPPELRLGEMLRPRRV